MSATVNIKTRLLVNNFVSMQGLFYVRNAFQSWRQLGTSAHLRNLAASSGSSNSGFLREAYHCNNAWKKRLDDPILKNINSLDDFFYDIDKRYQADKVISAIDVDLYANKVTDDENLDELQELVYRLRRSPATADALPSTSYAVIRAFLSAGKLEELMRILNDRWNYGIFLDFHIANILMDEFLKQGNTKDAAKVASLMMLEEDFGPPTSQYLALISCLSYLQNPSSEPWENSPAKDESDEEVKIRLHYIRNPYFDDHFDLVNSNHLIGKTLSLLGSHITGNEVLVTSVKLLGYALHGKWNKLDALLQECTKQKKTVAQEVINKISELCDGALAEIEASPNKTLAKPKVHQYPGVNLDEKNVTKMWQELNYPSQEEYVAKVKSFLASGKLSTTKELNLLDKAKELLSSALSELEDKEIKDQLETFEEWSKRRIEELDNQMKRFRKFEVSESIEARKKDLTEKEDVIFFFDNEEEWMMRLPPDEQQGYKLSTQYLPRNYEKFVRHVPPKKNIKKKKKE